MNTWDEAKRILNIAKHGVDFRELDDLEWNGAVIFEDHRRDYGELRLIAMVLLGDRLYVVVFVERDSVRRIISARKANSREVEFYERENSTSDS